MPTTKQTTPATDTQEQKIGAPEPAGGASGDAGRQFSGRGTDLSQGGVRGNDARRGEDWGNDVNQQADDRIGNVSQGRDRAGEANDDAEDEQATADPTADGTDEHAPAAPGFGERGRMRRRARFLRKARELAYRDLGGLVYDLHRFGQRNDPVVLAKLATLG